MIGIFDSGIGGLSVVKELIRVRPDASFIYLGDTARTPYGNKSKETVQRYALEDAACLISRGVRVIVVACNTVSALALDSLRSRYSGFPIFDVITPAIEDALAVTQGRIGVIGTRSTISSGVYQNRLAAASKAVNVIAQACPLFVPLVEEGWLDEAETKRIVKHYLYSLRAQNVDTLILGCTHYPLLAPLIQRFMGRHVNLIDSATSVVQRLISDIEIEHTGIQSYYLTDISPHSVEIARHWVGRKIKFEPAAL